MFLGGDPSYVQKDKELIEALDLNFKHVTAGAEPAQVARWSQLYKQEKPVIFYWYTPQYLNQQYDLAEVKLPPRTEANKDCQDDAKAGGDPEQYKCEYDVTIINKLFSKKFADSGSPAYDVLKNMKLTNEDRSRSPRRSPATRSTRRRPARTGSRTTGTRWTPGCSSHRPLHAAPFVTKLTAAPRSRALSLRRLPALARACLRDDVRSSRAVAPGRGSGTALDRVPG